MLIQLLSAHAYFVHFTGLLRSLFSSSSVFTHPTVRMCVLFFAIASLYVCLSFVAFHCPGQLTGITQWSHLGVCCCAYMLLHNNNNNNNNVIERVSDEIYFICSFVLLCFAFVLASLLSRAFGQTSFKLKLITAYNSKRCCADAVPYDVIWLWRRLNRTGGSPAQYWIQKFIMFSRLRAGHDRSD